MHITASAEKNGMPFENKYHNTQVEASFDSIFKVAVQNTYNVNDAE